MSLNPMTEMFWVEGGLSLMVEIIQKVCLNEELNEGTS